MHTGEHVDRVCTVRTGSSSWARLSLALTHILTPPVMSVVLLGCLTKVNPLSSSTTKTIMRNIAIMRYLQTAECRSMLGSCASTQRVGARTATVDTVTPGAHINRLAGHGWTATKASQQHPTSLLLQQSETQSRAYTVFV